MERVPQDRDLESTEERLRRSRPLPDSDFTRELERRLLPRERRERARWRIPVLAGAAAGGLAALFVGLSLAGAGPLSLDGDDDSSQARDECEFVPVRRTERVPRVVTGRDGEPRITYRKRRVTRYVERCR